MFTRDQVLEYLLRIRYEGRLQAMMGLLGRDGQAEDFQRMDESIHETYKEIGKKPKGELMGTIDGALHFAIDLDGTLLKYDGWKGEDHFGDPMEGAVEFVNAMLEKNYKVTVFTTRTAQSKVQQALIERGFPELPVTNIKSPKFSVFIDDRAYRFNGPPQWVEMKDWDWPKKVTPWNMGAPGA